MSNPYPKCCCNKCNGTYGPSIDLYGRICPEATLAISEPTKREVDGLNVVGGSDIAYYWWSTRNVADALEVYLANWQFDIGDYTAEIAAFGNPDRWQTDIPMTGIDEDETLHLEYPDPPASGAMVSESRSIRFYNFVIKEIQILTFCDGTYRIGNVRVEATTEGLTDGVSSDGVQDVLDFSSQVSQTCGVEASVDLYGSSMPVTADVATRTWTFSIGSPLRLAIEGSPYSKFKFGTSAPAACPGIAGPP